MRFINPENKEEENVWSLSLFYVIFFVGSLARTHSIQTFYLRPFIKIKVVPKHFLAFLWRINMIYKSPTTIFRYCEIATSSIWTNIITLSEHWASAYLHFESGKMEMTVCLLEPFLNSFEYNVFFFLPSLCDGKERRLQSNACIASSTVTWLCLLSQNHHFNCSATSMLTNKIKIKYLHLRCWFYSNIVAILYCQCLSQHIETVSLMKIASEKQK